MRATQKFGFTIVELLVVITIIGLLMALLLPAVGRARDNARRVQCINQMKQLGTATLNYTSSKDYYPGYVSEMPLDAPSVNTVLVTWFVKLLPMMDRSDVYDRMQTGVAPSDVYIDSAVCPTNAPDIKGAPSLGYVINSGVWDDDVPMTLTSGTHSSGRGSRDVKANGISHNLAGLLGRYPGLNQAKAKVVKKQAMDVRVSPSYVSSGDGSSTTILMSENIDAAGLWYGHDWVSDPLAQGRVGIVWMAEMDQQAKINRHVQEMPLQENNARPSSNHSGVVVVTFADGHAELLNEEVDPTVYARLMTPNGKESDVDRSSSVMTPPWQLQPVSSTDLAK